MTDASAISGTTTTPTTTTGTTGATGTSGSAAAGTATVSNTASGTVVTITQPDRSKFQYVIPTMGSTVVKNPDGTTQTVWTPTPADGMSDLAKKNNAKYNQTLNADDFMKLLVAQLQYQDPSKPADTAQMMQQTASMSMVERINEMAGAAESMTKSSESLAAANKDLIASNTAMTQHLGSLLAQQSLSAAIGLIGQTVTYTKGTGDTATTEQGTVESVKIGADGPILKVNGTDVPVDSITAVARGTATQA
ncbi:flagellar basal body rod modification protein [Dermatophilus congolensis]|uniref:Basal-body rod modification protein FlgD n=1 Tax=Dermatophilus congolensis TaxID=1863 RepID=A0AA46H0X1_9MICO|nr:flagellar hook capping FlgD N-terminal domain-containing protein [Dermatophilus congolensis]STD11759.1 flagellar basal body rod modification protein [Dermatophilus congolensis]